MEFEFCRYSIFDCRYYTPRHPTCHTNKIRQSHFCWLFSFSGRFLRASTTAAITRWQPVTSKQITGWTFRILEDIKLTSSTAQWLVNDVAWRLDRQNDVCRVVQSLIEQEQQSLQQLQPSNHSNPSHHAEKATSSSSSIHKSTLPHPRVIRVVVLDFQKGKAPSQHQSTTETNHLLLLRYLRFIFTWIMIILSWTFMIKALAFYHPTSSTYKNNKSKTKIKPRTSLRLLRTLLHSPMPNGTLDLPIRQV